LPRANSIGSRNDKRETSSAMTHKKIEILRPPILLGGLRMTARGRVRMTVGRFAQWQGGN